MRVYILIEVSNSKIRGIFLDYESAISMVNSLGIVNIVNHNYRIEVHQIIEN